MHVHVVVVFPPYLYENTKCVCVDDRVCMILCLIKEMNVWDEMKMLEEGGGYIYTSNGI